MRVPLRHRRKKSKWDLSFEQDKPEHVYKEIKKIVAKNTTDVIAKCELCGCERRRIVRNKDKVILGVTYTRTGISTSYSPQCWGAKNPV